MKRLWIVCMAAVMLVLTACAPIAQPDTTTAPPETTAAPVETTAPEETTAPDQETAQAEEDPLVTEFKELFTFTAQSDVWYNYALKSYYTEPSGIDIFKLIYSAPWQGAELTQAEKDFLTGQGMDLETSFVHKYPVEKIDEVLQKYFGITFEEAQGIGLDKMVYNPDTNSYYHMHGDFESADLTISDVEAKEDESFIVYYKQGGTGESCAVTLQKKENGEYWILSNIVLE